MQIVIGNNQNRTRDSYAPAPVINLTLRANGEEQVQVMDSLGQFVPAGILPPSVAPTVAVGTGVPFATVANQWVCYLYVYAAQTRYPLVENANAPQGKLGPRSNPSTRSAAYQVDALGKSILVTVTKSDRVDVDQIWIYRTAFFPTQTEAEDAAEAGAATYLDAVIDNGTAGTRTYTDTTLIIDGNFSVETDNFPAPQMQFVTFDDPYFYGIGNFPFIGNISVDANGLVTLTTATDKWFDGRNGQVVTMTGITSGGFDGYGSYYFKWLTNTTAQLCLDALLTQNGPVNYTGTTIIKVQGRANILYRSKPRNPFSWGFTEVIEDTNVPQPYAFVVGGGQATAITVVPILNLLKIDTQGPNKCFVMNLNGKGTPAFEASKREISSDYSVSNAWSQFTTKGKDGNSYVWFFDSKNFSICQSDGSSNIEVSSPVFDSLHALSANIADANLSHAIYEPSLQLACIWLTSRNIGLSGGGIVNNLLLTYHHPTDSWGKVECPDVTCSAPFRDQTTNEQFVLLGTNKGKIGRMAEKNTYTNWFSSLAAALPATYVNGFEVKIAGDHTVPTGNDQWIGTWCYLVGTNADPLFNYLNNRVLCSARVDSVSYDGVNTHIHFDKILDRNNSTIFLDLLPGVQPPNPTTTLTIYPGMIFATVAKFINLEDTTSPKKLTQVWLTASTTDLSMQGMLAMEYNINDAFLGPDSPVPFQFTALQQNNQQGGTFTSSMTYKKDTPTTIDTLRSFTLYFQQLGFQPVKFYNFTVVIGNA